MKPILIAAALAGCLATPLAAQTPPGAPAAAEPGAPPPAGEAPKPETLQQRQERSATKLAGLVIFVTNSCPEAQPDYDRFKTVITAMGVKVDDLSQGLLAVRSAEYTQAYQKEPVESCRRAFENFGEGGRVIPGLIARRAPDAKPVDTAPSTPTSPETKQP